MSSKVANSKLLKLLYDSTATEANRRVPLAVKYLQASGSSSSGSSSSPSPSFIGGSALDNLLQNDWNQKPFHQAIASLPKHPDTTTQSNILMLQCPNSLLVNTDFYNIYPLQRDRMFLLPNSLKLGIKFSVIKARHPLSLSFRNAYYLVFPSYTHAATYWLETRNKAVNGFPWKLRFVDINDHLKYMASPWLSPDTQLAPLNSQTMVGVPTGDIFKHSARKFKLMNSVSESHFDTNYETINEFVDISSRAACVVVRNLPFGLSKHALPRLLWDYDFPELPQQKCFVPIIRDPLSQLNLTLIRFKDHENAKRFVRSFHGKRWHGFRSGADKEKFKRLYEPLLCEIVN